MPIIGPKFDEVLPNYHITCLHCFGPVIPQVKKQLLALSKLTPPGIGNAHDPKSAPGTVRGLPKFDAKPVKSILKRNQSVDDSAEESASTSKFFLGDSNSTMNTEVTPSPVIPRKSAMKKYNPYHTFSGEARMGSLFGCSN